MPESNATQLYYEASETDVLKLSGIIILYRR